MVLKRKEHEAAADLWTGRAFTRFLGPGLRYGAQDFSHILHCKLKRFNLMSAPPYTALSYTWGSKNGSIPIFVGNGQLRVGPNLAQFLFNERCRPQGTTYL